MVKITEFSNKTNLILQSYFTIVLLKELSKDNNLLESEYFKNLQFDDNGIKEALKTTKIDNQGVLSISLYAMLVVPGELLSYKKFKNDFENLNNYIANIQQKENSTYKNDNKKIDYIRHIRNSVAHAKIDIIPQKYVTFNDNNEQDTFKIEIPLSKMGDFLGEIQKNHFKYINEIASTSYLQVG